MKKKRKGEGEGILGYYDEAHGVKRVSHSEKKGEAGILECLESKREKKEGNSLPKSKGVNRSPGEWVRTSRARPIAREGYESRKKRKKPSRLRKKRDAGLPNRSPRIRWRRREAKKRNSTCKGGGGPKHPDARWGVEKDTTFPGFGIDAVVGVRMQRSCEEEDSRIVGTPKGRRSGTSSIGSREYEGGN